MVLHESRLGFMISFSVSKHCNDLFYVFLIQSEIDLIGAKSSKCTYKIRWVCELEYKINSHTKSIINKILHYIAEFKEMLKVK